MIPFATIQSQEKKNEQKIKIIVKDGSGTKVMIDTVLRGDNGPDSLTLKDGSVVHMKHLKGEGKQMFVTYSSDDKDGKSYTKEMTVISDDSLDMEVDERPNVMHYKYDRDGHHGHKVMTQSAGGDDKEEMVIINKERHRGGDKTFERSISDDSGVEKTRIVIAKDGMVVTIEGTDEVKAKELAKEIEQKLGINGPDEKKEITTNKTQKKKVK